MRKISVFAIALLWGLGQIVACMAADPPKTGEKRDTMIYVRSDPPGAKVLLDGKELGKTNGLFRVEAGVATIILELEGHGQVKRPISIRADGITRIEIELKPQTPPADEEESETVAALRREAEAGNYFAKYRLWEGYQKGTDGIARNPEKAKKLLREFIKGVYLAKFRPVNGFAPTTPMEFLANCNEHSSLRSAPMGRIGGASFFRTTAKDGVLIGSFLTEYPDKMRKDIEDNPSLELISIEKVAPEMFVRYDASPQESLDGAEKEHPRSGNDLASQQQMKARKRMQQDARAFSDQQRSEIESLYQVANQRWQTQEARDSLKTLVEKYKKANRTGCAILYLGQMSQGDEQIAYFKQAIADHSDCFYGDGVQVGAFARFLLGQAYLKSGNADLAKTLFDQLRKDYPGSVDHRGNSLVAQLPRDESRGDPTKKPPAKDNILKNPGFEAGDKTPDAWEQGMEIEGVTYSWDKKVASEGKASLCIEKTAERYFPIAQWSQTVDRKGDSSVLEVSAQVKAEKMTKAILDVVFLDKDGQWISHKWAAYIGSKQDGDPPANHDWKKYSGKVEIPKDTARLCIGLQVYGPGKVWFDDVRASYETAGPQVVSMNPPNGAKDVDPAITELRVTFNVPMAGGFSWTGGGPNFPKTAGRPHWTADRKTCVLPVELQPNWDYRLGLNSRSFKNFRSKSGVPLEPVAYRFTTRGDAAEAETPTTP